jgi:signal transduction histidine kinase/ActR/RegA family two-component response regulator
MSEATGMMPYVLDIVAERARNHAPTLADFAARVEPHASELIAAWADAHRAIAGTDAATRGAMSDEVVRIFFGGLRFGNLREAYAGLEDWARQLAQSSLVYDRALTLTNEYQRALLPILLRAYTPGPEAQLAFDALDELFAGMATLIGAAYVESGQERASAGSQLRVIGQLTGGAIHSLSDVFAAIIGRAQLVQELSRESETRGEINAIGQSAATGALMLRRLQDFARAEPQARFVETDVNLVLRDAAEVTRFMWRDQSEANGLFVDVVRDFAEVPPVRAQPTQMRRVLVELLLNAIDAMPRGGVITLRTERKENQVLVSVIDNGEGMDAATRARIFDPFFTTKGAPHLGLGLTMVARILTEHNGAWTIESAPGRGTTFTLALAIAPRVAERRSPAPVAINAVNILVVDNERSVREMMTRLLASFGHAVASAESGSEAIALFKKTGFDLVFTDLGMPGMSGWEVAREIKRLDANAVVVLMSGWAISLDSQRAREMGVDRVLQKPFDVDYLQSLIAESVALRKPM